MASSVLWSLIFWLCVRSTRALFLDRPMARWPDARPMQLNVAGAGLTETLKATWKKPEADGRNTEGTSTSTKMK